MKKTIFTITAESKDAVEGVLNIDINAFDKIILTPDYLEGACTYSGSGSQLRVIQPGLYPRRMAPGSSKNRLLLNLNNCI
jgi:hypothetical protein